MLVLEKVGREIFKGIIFTKLKTERDGGLFDLQELVKSIGNSK